MKTSLPTPLTDCTTNVATASSQISSGSPGGSRTLASSSSPLSALEPRRRHATGARFAVAPREALEDTREVRLILESDRLSASATDMAVPTSIS